MPIQNTLPFTNVSEITFDATATELKIKVNGSLLGSICSSYAATVFITNTAGSKTITFKQISNNEYSAGNTNNMLVDTVYYNFNSKKCDTKIGICSASVDTFKIIGWDTEDTGQICSGNGHTHFFNISSESQLKAKVEQVVINSQTVTRMVARYLGNIYQSETLSTAPCYTGLYCYVCTI